MDPETLATLAQAAGGAAGAVKTVVEALTLTRGKVKGNREAEEQLSESIQLVLDLQTRLLDLQAKAFSLQGELSKLQEQNTQLREQIREEEKRSADRKQYQRKKVGQATVVVSEEDPETYFCPTCFEKSKQTVAIQSHPMRGGSFGSHYCYTCKTSFRIQGG
jgi:septal ring factor EnvC (AmiA/AmiB activator)